VAVKAADHGASVSRRGGPPQPVGEEAEPVFIAVLRRFLAEPCVGFIAGNIEIAAGEGFDKAGLYFRGESRPSKIKIPRNGSREGTSPRSILSF
jgi:hypothetical protein